MREHARARLRSRRGTLRGRGCVSVSADLRVVSEPRTVKSPSGRKLGHARSTQPQARAIFQGDCCSRDDGPGLGPQAMAMPTRGPEGSLRGPEHLPCGARTSARGDRLSRDRPWRKRWTETSRQLWCQLVMAFHCSFRIPFPSSLKYDKEDLLRRSESQDITSGPLSEARDRVGHMAR